MTTITKDARRFIFSFKPKPFTADIQTTCNLTRIPGNIYKYLGYLRENIKLLVSFMMVGRHWWTIGPLRHTFRELAMHPDKHLLQEWATGTQ